MPTRGPTPPRPDQGALLGEVNQSIADAVASSSAQATVLMILARTGYDTSEALDAFWTDMDALAVLRSLRCYLHPTS